MTQPGIRNMTIDLGRRLHVYEVLKARLFVGIQVDQDKSASS